MPSIAIPKVSTAITAATNKGLVTVGSGLSAGLYPGAYAWISIDDGSIPSVRVKILSVDSSSDTIRCRIMPSIQATDSNTHYTSETNPPPSYGLSDLSAFNTGSHIFQERQTAPVDPAFSKRDVP